MCIRDRKTYSEIAELFNSHGVCWGKFQTIKEMLTDDPACSTENPMFSKVEQPNIGPTLTPASPLNFGVGRDSARPAPYLGEHTEMVLLDHLRLSSGTLGGLLERGIISLARQSR